MYSSNREKQKEEERKMNVLSIDKEVCMLGINCWLIFFILVKTYFCAT